MAWYGRLVVACVLLVALAQATLALKESREAFVGARAERRSTVERAQERRFGAAYMRALREARDRIPEDSLVLLIDAQRAEQGSAYFVVHYLAPRKLVRLGVLHRQSARRVLQRFPREDSWLIVVHDGDRPLEIWRSLDYRQELVRRARTTPD